MTPAEAAQILDLPPTASADQVEARYNELRLKIEDKIAKAPTPGLKSKYRESLDEITLAFETLTLAADSSALPVLKKGAGDGAVGSPLAGGPSAARPQGPALQGSANPKSRIQNQKSGKEFALVSIIAVAVLVAGGWFVMKTRAENAEKARLAAVAAEAAERAAADRAEADRVAQQAREQAERDKEARVRQAEADREKQERLGVQLRSRLAEMNFTLEAVLKGETAAERELSELKAEERVLQREARGNASPDLRAAQAAAAAQEKYCTWLREHLAAHPARLTRAKLEELAAAKAWDEVAAGIDAYAAALKQLQADIAAQRDEHLVLTGSLRVTAEPAEVDFELKDAYGRIRSGRTPAELTDVPLGPATVTFQRSGWPAASQSAVVQRNVAAAVRGDLVGGGLSLGSTPFPVDFVLAGQGRSDRGRTPATLGELPVGTYQVTYSRPGWPAQTLAAEVTRAGKSSSEASFAPPGSIKVETQPAGATVTVEGKVVGLTPLTLADLPPGEWRAGVSLPDYRPLSLQGTVEAGKETVVSGTLRSAALTPEEAFEKFASDANGSWVCYGKNGLGGSATFFLRFVKGSRTLSFEMTGFGGSVRNLTMVEYDAANRIVLATFGGINALNGKLGLKLDGDTLLFGKAKLTDPMVFHRQ